MTLLRAAAAAGPNTEAQLLAASDSDWDDVRAAQARECAGE